MIHVYGDSLSSLSLASGLSGGISLFSLAHGMAGSEGHVRVNRLKPRPNIHLCGACAVCRCVLVRIMAACTVSAGCSLSCSLLHPESQFENKNSALAMMKL